MEAYTYFGKGRDDGEEAGEFSAIFYNKNSFELLQEHTFWLSETPETPSKGWDAAIKRVCTYGKFRAKNDTSVFWVFNTHFDHIGEQARKESIFLILKKIATINAEALPVILMGDLNLEPKHESIIYLADKMDDTFIAAGEHSFGPAGTFNGFKFDEPVNRRIDYVFTSKGDFIVRKNAILSDSKECRYPSDHLPVYAKLEFK
jgi:endonuclease/exonuclease/phosphatase family metal-dependent hydrolase